jgi:cytosine/adenosine deaminase-related metal-dependent hydrolase
MRAIKSDYIVTCDKDFTILQNSAIIFDDKIVEIIHSDRVKEKYPNIEVIETKPNSIIMPGLVNTHIHLEFSKNKTTLEYGDFVSWLKSVIVNREELIEGVDEEFLLPVLDSIIKSGTTTIGAVSSYGFEISACKKSPIRAVLFNEAIGSKPDMIDDLYSIFLGRLNETYSLADSRFIPAIAIHSPYSIHPVLTRKVLQIAKEEEHIVTTHFMESMSEREWLEGSSGDFYDFFDKFLGIQNSLITPSEFLKQFSGHKTLFVHNTIATKDELEFIKNNDSSLVHCPVSNRLLTNSALDLDLVEKIGVDFSIGTDGLSSNYSLSMFDELRSALFTHTTKDINSFANKLLMSATSGGASSLNINSGAIESGKHSDFLVVDMGSEIKDTNSLAMQIILHTKEPSSVYIGGDKI